MWGTGKVYWVGDQHDQRLSGIRSPGLLERGSWGRGRCVGAVPAC